MNAHIELNHLYDKTGLLNAPFGPVIKDYAEFSPFVSINPSAWQFYPKKYKFFGMQINLSDKSIDVKRSTFDLLALFSQFGGVQRALMMLLAPFVSWIAKKNLLSMITNRYYTGNGIKKPRNEIKEFFCRGIKKAQLNDEKSEKALSGNIPIPLYFNWTVVFFTYVCCCFKPK